MTNHSGASDNPNTLAAQIILLFFLFSVINGGITLLAYHLLVQSFSWALLIGGFWASTLMGLFIAWASRVLPKIENQQ